MNFPYICIDEKKRYFFTRLQVYKWRNSLDVFEYRRLTRDVLPALARLIEELGRSGAAILVVNCSGITSRQDPDQARRRMPDLERQENEIREKVERAGVMVLFTCCSGRLFRLLSDVFYSTRLSPPGLPAESFLVGPQEAADRKETDYAELARADGAYVRTLVANCFKRRDNGRDTLTLRSTPLKANGYFDANLLLGNPVVFPWLACLLADRLRALIEPPPSRGGDSTSDGAAPDDGDEPTYRLLACTRNGAVLASAVRGLLPPSLLVDVVDRFGPVPRTIEAYDGDASIVDGPGAREAYIYVGDFVIAGTELRMAEAHAYYRKRQLAAGLVIGSVIGADPTQFEFGRVQVHSLFALRELVPDLTYWFPPEAPQPGARA